jgi:hypothetical protein
MAELLEYETPDRAVLPAALVVVAWLFIALGISSIVGMVWEAFNGRLHLDLLALVNILAGRGLLARRRGWRTYALVILLLSMFGSGLMFVMNIIGIGKTKMTIGGKPHAATTLESVGVLILVALAFALCVWCFRILIRPDVRRMFYAPIDAGEVEAAAKRLDEMC